MLKLWRRNSFWTEPWFLTLAVILGQIYGVWWMSLGSTPDPIYVPQVMVATAGNDGLNLDIIANSEPAFREAAN